MCLFKILELFLLLLIANVVEILCQGPAFEPAPKGWTDGENCNRDCNGTRLQCFYHFRVETTYTMSKACYSCPTIADDCFRPDCIIGGGVQRVVSAVNRRIPGPSIEVCEGDNVRVLVENVLTTGESTSIHWHGLHMRYNPYMDGVPYVTQCPIQSNNNFTYQFIVLTPGTHWWHSHRADQRGDGLFGSLIVRQVPERNYHYNNYDFDNHVMLITDWNDRRKMEVLQGFFNGGHLEEPTGILINGLGDLMNNNISGTPRANFDVEEGFVYRIRVVNAGFYDCPIEISIDNHTMTVIATDGQDVVPKEIDAIENHSGERYDFTFKADKPVGTYWIRVKGIKLCERLKTFQLATLTYKGSTSTMGAGPMPTYETANDLKSLVLNPVFVQKHPSPITINQLENVRPIPARLSTKEVKRFFVSLDMSGIDNPANNRKGVYGYDEVENPKYKIRTAQLNHITFKHFSFNIMHNRYNITKDQFCNDKTTKDSNCEKKYCACAHVLEVNLGDVVEMVIFDENNQEDAPAVHPMHMHGFSFYVLHWGELGYNLTVSRIKKEHHKYARNLVNPPLKDTVTVPRGGVVIIRFIADNPGFWLWHCHIDMHTIEGMELVFKVGKNSEIRDPPKKFPVCGNFQE